MKSTKILKQAKQSARNHYVRKKDFEQLQAELKRLKKALRQLEGCCQPPAPESVEAGTAEVADPAADKDDLKRINGIGKVLEDKLNGLGINRIAQVAAFTPADIDRISEHLNFKGRIERDQWIEQAQELIRAPSR